MILLRLLHDDNLTRATVEIERDASIIVYSTDENKLSVRDAMRMSLALNAAASIVQSLKLYEQLDNQLCAERL